MKMLDQIDPNIDPWVTPRITFNHSLKEEAALY